MTKPKGIATMSDDSLREWATMPDEVNVYPEDVRPLAEELLAARATIAGVRKAAELYSRDSLSANIRMIGADLLEFIDHPAKGK